jgi:peptidoglycan/LPS O-acetylase OafA/YrhL
MEKGRHLLFFDILRIGAILMVVYQHVATVLNLNFPTVNIFGTVSGIGKVGNILFIFISGAVLYISTKETNFTIKNTLPFYKKRIMRLYPAMWASYIFAILFVPTLVNQSLKLWVIQLTGTISLFLNITSQDVWYHLINPIAYFVGLILVLYILYPIIYNAMKYYPNLILLISSGISYLCIRNYPTSFDYGNPLSYLMFFVGGIYIAKFGIYPKVTISSNNIIAHLSELSFYVFLTHDIILNREYSNMLRFVIFSIVLAYIAWYIDNIVQLKLKKINCCSVDKQMSNPKREHLLFFDILRIGAILMVVYQHILSSINENVPSIMIMGETLGIGKIGVLVFVTVSGALLFISTSETTFTFSNVLPFYYKKFVRLYPALWMSFIITIIAEPQILQYQSTKDWIIQLTGTTVYFMDITNLTVWSHLINPVSYFISLLIGLYLIYPLVHNLTKYLSFLTIIGAIAISVASKFYYNISFGSGNPLIYLMFFVLGAHIAIMGLYPKISINSKSGIVVASSLSFYVFLTHGIMINIWYNNILMFAIATLGMSSLLMIVDDKIQSDIKKIVIKNYEARTVLS